MKTSKTLTFLACAAFLSLVASCGGSSGEHAEAPPRSDLPERFYLADVPDGVIDVGAAHESAEDGDPIVVRGVVGGSAKPFVEGLAAFTVVDAALESCVGDGMGCPTPWDYCCEDPHTIAVSSATIELREGDAPLAASPRGFHGLDHLVTVVVQGTARRDERGNLTLVATGLHPQP
jgi:hypothetical protein